MGVVKQLNYAEAEIWVLEVCTECNVRHEAVIEGVVWKIL